MDHPQRSNSPYLPLAEGNLSHTQNLGRIDSEDDENRSLLQCFCGCLIKIGFFALIIITLLFAVLTYEDDHKGAYYACAFVGVCLLSYWCCCCLFDPCYSFFGVGKGPPRASERDSLHHNVHYNSTNSLYS